MCAFVRAIRTCTNVMRLLNFLCFSHTRTNKHTQQLFHIESAVALHYLAIPPVRDCTACGPQATDAARRVGTATGATENAAPPHAMPIQASFFNMHSLMCLFLSLPHINQFFFLSSRARGFGQMSPHPHAALIALVPLCLLQAVVGFQTSCGSLVAPVAGILSERQPK